MRRFSRGLLATLCVALMVLTLGGAASDSPDAMHGVRVSWAPLGLNTAPWDGSLVGQSGQALRPMLEKAGIGMLRYGGGSAADGFGWESGADVQGCPQGGSNAVSPALGAGGCASASTLGFGGFSDQAAKLGASSFVTANYGTGTPAEAGAWVKDSTKAPGRGVSLWEVGNETYGCWESNDWLEQPPTNYEGYVPSAGQGAASSPSCPRTSLGDVIGTQIMANSYAAHVAAFIKAMKGASKSAQIGVPWAFGSDVPGAAVPADTAWNDTVLSENSGNVGFVDAHYYPFTFSGSTGSGSTGNGNPDDQQILQSLTRIPSLYGEIRSTLSVYDPKASVIVGETNVSSAETTTVCQPVGALFAAGDVLSWLAAGAQSIDWWDMDNDGNTGGACTKPDFGMFTSPADGQPPRPETPYYGYQLASILARPGAQLAPLPTSDLNDVIAFQSALPGGKTALAFLNTNTTQSEHVTFQVPPGMSGSGVSGSGVSGSGISGSGHRLRTWTYSNSSPSVATGSEDSGVLSGGVTLAPESMTVLRTTS